MATRVQGQDATSLGRKIHQGRFIFDITDDKAFVIRKDGDGGDIFVVDTNSSPAVVTITGNLVVSGSGSGIAWDDDVALTMGTSDPYSQLYETADANANAFLVSLPAGGATDVPVFIIGNAATTSVIDVDLGLFNGITFSTLAVLDNDNDSWIGLDHSANDAPRLRSNKAFLVGDAAANLLVTVDGGSSGVRLNDTASIGRAVKTNAFLAFPDSTTSVASINLGSTGAAPSSPNEGDIWYDGTNFVGRDGTANRSLDVQSSSGGGWTDDGAIVRLTTAADNIIVGDTANVSIGGATPKFALLDTDTTAMIAISHYAADAVGPEFAFAKSRGSLGTVGTTVAANDVIGTISWFGDDATDFTNAVARIEVQVKATVADNQLPGEMVISTAASNGTLTAAMTIDLSQDVTYTGSIFLANAEKIGISGNELITFNTAGNIDVTGAEFRITAGDLLMYDANNDGNPKHTMGSTSADDFEVTAVFNSGAQTLDKVTFITTTASATASDGRYQFDVDAVTVLTINDASLSTSLDLVGGITTTTASVFVGDLSLDGDLDFVGAQEIATGGANLLTINGGTAGAFIKDILLVGDSSNSDLRVSQAIQITTTNDFGGMSFSTYSTVNGDAQLVEFNKSGTATPGSHTAMQDNELIGIFNYRGSDGAAFIDTATIRVVIDGTPASNDMPGSIEFLINPGGGTTADLQWTMNAAGNLVSNGAASITTGGNANLTLNPGTSNVLITDGSGFVVGHTAQVVVGAITPEAQIMGIDNVAGNLAIFNFAADTQAAILTLNKSRGALGTVGTVIVSGDDIGIISFFGDDGTDLAQEVARILVNSSGTIGANQVPGEIIFQTAIDTGGSALATALTLDDNQDVFLEATKKLYLDGGTNTYIDESASDVMNLVVGGQTMITLTEAAADIVEFTVPTGYTPSSDQARAADSTIVIDNGIVRVAGDGAARILSVAPSIEDGSKDGQIVIIQGTNDTNTLQINDGTNTQLAGGANVVLGQGDTLVAIWDSGDSVWYEISRANN